ncbi:MAG: carboxypeptidase-like regulatory domain-containing protein [Planctomycetaceae bacterium]|nr:carboxypeptidase-like regulatory domain-containing protein [Planctomycetaceae bacterium]
MLRFFIVLSLLCGVIGCNRNPYGTVLVTGIVHVDGKPMEQVTVSFQSTDGSQMGAVGTTDAQGKFVLTTGMAPFGSGVIPGQYHVTFAKSELPEKYRTETTEEFMQKFGNIEVPFIFIVPKKYGNAATSDIAPVTVEKKGKKHFEFDLSTSPNNP